MNPQSRFFILISILLLSVACTSEQEIRKSALRYFQEGNSSFQHRDYQSAIWNYQKAISLDSETPNFYYNLGLTYFEIGNYDEAIDSFKRVETLAPNLSANYYNMSLAYYKLSQTRMADLYFNRYQDILSLKKAKERLEKKREDKLRDQRKNALKESPVSNSSQQKTKTGKKAQSTRLKKGTSQIPNWDS